MVPKTAYFGQVPPFFLEDSSIVSWHHTMSTCRLYSLVRYIKSTTEPREFHPGEHPAGNTKQSSVVGI